MKTIRRQHVPATLFPASMLSLVRPQNQFENVAHSADVVLLTGSLSELDSRIRLIAEAFVRAGKTVRIAKTI